MGVYNNDNGVLSPIAGRGNIDGVYRANGILGAKNLLPNNAKNQTINGVTFTVNDDGSVTVNGTATANITTYFIDTAISLKAGKYLISGTPNSIFAKDSTGIRISNNDYSINIYGDEDGTSFTLDNDTSGLRVDIRIESGTTVSNLTFYPMLRLASDTDSTYQPYAKTNKELTDGLVYSTDEINTGKTWIDGKPIYRKVFVINNPLTRWTSNELASGVNEVIDAQLYIDNGNGYLTRPYFHNDNDYLEALATVTTDSHKLRAFINVPSTITPLKLTVIAEYTKTS